MTLVSFSPLKIKGMRESVAETLRLAIVQGSFRPGDALRDNELAEQLNVSRSPVREALMQLEKEGLVKNVHNRGWFVIELTADELSEIVSLRAILEVLALELAAKKASRRDIEGLTGINNEMLRAVKKGDGVRLCKENYEFHLWIWKLSGHRLLQDTLTKIANPYFAFLQTIIRTPELPLDDHQKTIDHHQLLIDYLSRKTKLNAAECMAVHFAYLKVKDWDLFLRKATRKS